MSKIFRCVCPEQVTLQFGSNIVDAKTKLEMFDIHGKRLNKQLIAVGKGNNNFTLNISQYTSGVYFIKVTTKGYIKNVKLIIE